MMSLFSSGVVSTRPAGGATVIEASRGWVPLHLRELWEYREVLYFLIWRDIKVRYRQTLIGVAWVIVQPLMTMTVFTIFFGRVVRIPSDGVPYSVFVLAGLVPWLFFASGLSSSANSLVLNSHLISKVYFPRLLLPLARILGGFPDLGISLLLLATVVWYHGLPIRPALLLWLPVFLLLACVTSFGVSLWLSALNVRYRDVQHIIPFLIQIWMFSTPIAYPSSLLSDRARTIYGLNPMVGVVDGFRWTLLGTGEPPWPSVAASAAAAVVILILGAFFFRRAERSFADLV